MQSVLYGRELLWNELPHELQILIDEEDLKIDSRAAYIIDKGKILCRRCQQEMTRVKRNECICGEDCAYCQSCLKTGKVRKCSLFYSLAEINGFKESKASLLAWTGKLSDQQKLASKDIIETITKKETRLLWAVAGAGKTEMLFPGIEYALKMNERVCIASPRIDVCLELAPRIKEAFPSVPLSVLYGDMEEDYQYRQLTIATTHQLFRFREAFDLLIIDEIDAFPFENDESLKIAAEKARKEKAALIYLTATPNRMMQKEIKQGKLEATILPARYHGHQLPLPKTKWSVNWQEKLFTRFKRTTFGKIFDEKIKSRKRFLLFVPNIDWMKRFEGHLKEIYPNTKFESVSSEDPLRKEKVLKMRAFELEFLITTTILERGVTFPNIDVLVIGAEESIYSESALVQIAGRCGRSADYPTGEVIFFHDGKTLAMKRAIKQINQMNQLALDRGLVE